MIYTDKKQLVKLVSYMSTFDGGLYLPSKKGKNNAQFIMNMKAEHRDYLEWVQQTLNLITGTRLTIRPDYNSDGFERQPQLRLESNRHPFLTTIRDRIYIDRQKVIDPHMLKLMDEEALAIIFMADGGTFLQKRFKNPHAYINLHTKGFSYHDNLALGKAIYDTLGVHTNIHKHSKYYYLNIPKKSHEDFIRHVLPHMCKSFLYKLENLSPALGEDIVWSLRERRESLGNKEAQLIAE
jgi:hypothetical protein